MSTQHGHLPGSRTEPAEKLLKAAIHLWNHPKHPERIGRPTPLFVTVSRQPGTGAGLFSHRLAHRLNRVDEAAWAAWDHELMEKVSAEHGIAKNILEMIEERPHSWIDRLVGNLPFGDQTADAVDLRTYKHVMMAIRALAEAGHAILVGQGGVFVTEGIPRGIHLRLVAPLEHRIKYMAERDKVSLTEAAEHITHTEQKRAMFYRRYWPKRSIGPETFALTLNSAELSTDEMVECVLSLIRQRELIQEGPLACEPRTGMVVGGAATSSGASAFHGGAA